VEWRIWFQFCASLVRVDETRKSQKENPWTAFLLAWRVLAPALWCLKRLTMSMGCATIHLLAFFSSLLCRDIDQLTVEDTSTNANIFTHQPASLGAAMMRLAILAPRVRPHFLGFGSLPSARPELHRGASLWYSLAPAPVYS
jgi:hypothetical protein